LAGICATVGESRKLTIASPALVFDQTKPNLGITFLDPLDHIADAARHVIAAVGKRIKYYCLVQIVVALTLQSEFHETIATFSIGDRNVWPSKEIEPTWHRRLRR
jgi:hypothetical protein